MIKIILPWPPSVNTYYRKVGNKMLISKKGREYRKAVKIICAKATVNKKLTGKLKLYAKCYPPDNRQRDLDNLNKALLDSLEKAGVYCDDNQVKSLFLNAEKTIKNGVVEIEIAEENEGFEIVVNYY
jgi:crossover junction endodeoxyribonuclease RusA